MSKITKFGQINTRILGVKNFKILIFHLLEFGDLDLPLLTPPDH
jgi:hypothetical protein